MRMLLSEKRYVLLWLWFLVVVENLTLCAVRSAVVAEHLWRYGAPEIRYNNT
jgi:hypothetical protein